MSATAIKWAVAVGLALVLMAGSFYAAWTWQANSYGKQLATQSAGFQADLTAINNAGAAQTSAALTKQKAAEDQAAASDALRTQEKTNALAETNRCASSTPRPRPLMKSCALLLLLALSGCASQVAAPQVVTVAAGCPTPPAPPAPPAGAMQEQSNSVEKLDKLFRSPGRPHPRSRRPEGAAGLAQAGYQDAQLGCRSKWPQRD